MSANVERVFKMTPPDGEPFMAAVVRQDDGLRVVSNRGGKWSSEASIGVADLVMPEQRLSEWDVEEMKRPDHPVPT
jgi:hypothetical protein